MDATLTAQRETLFSEVPIQEPIESRQDRQEVELTTLEAIDGAERLPMDIYYEFGEEITKRILRGTGELGLCIDDRGLIVIPETKSVLIPRHSVPYVERWVRGPWRDAIANFETSFLTLKVTPVTPDNNKQTARDRVDIDPEDLENMTIGKVQKDSTIKTEQILGDDAETVADKKTYSRVYSLVAAGLQRGLLKEDDVAPHQRQPTDIRDLSKLLPREVISYYNMMYRGPEAGTDYTGVGIIEEISKNSAISAEDAYSAEESGFNAEIVLPEKNLMEDILPESVSLAEEYIQPVLPAINTAITAFNAANRRNVYTPVRGDDPVGTLFYKKREQKYYKRPVLSENLVPIVLSPEVCVFRGHRGMFAEDILVVVKTETDSEWKSHFFERYAGEKILGETIDSWLKAEDLM